MSSKQYAILAPALAAIALLFSAGAKAEQFCDYDGCAEFPDGVRSFADAVVAYNPTGNLADLVKNTDESLGPPDSDFTALYNCYTFVRCTFTTLGSGGSITYQFTDNVLTGSGDAAEDLYIFETGPLTQGMYVEISADGSNWHDVGYVVGDVSGIDIDAFGFGPTSLFRYVRLTDDNMITDPDEESETAELAGADIDAIGAIASAQARRFSDVAPEYWAFNFVEQLAASAITGGCGNGNYCPEDSVTRAQMAVFLERGIHGSDFSPPAASGTLFLDVAANAFAAAFIEQLFVDGITGGCGNNKYCPSDPVTRGQMAVFLLRAKHGSSYLPPPATGVFSDVPLNMSFAPWIEQLAVESITGGCGNGNYCPENPVTRAQMAVFLVRTFAL